MLAGKEAIDLYYFGRAHTNGDTFVVFRALRVMHAGDIVPAQGHAADRRQQRRQRRRLSGDARARRRPASRTWTR